jgi:hypothetical protein
MEYIVVLGTSYFRYLGSAPKVHWQAAAEAPARSISNPHSNFKVAMKPC